jgi:hypothetical protein
MQNHSRRRSLSDVGQGALLASLGSSLFGDLGLGSCLADDSPRRLTFGDLDPLVAIMDETPLDRLIPALVDEVKRGTPPARLVAAAALANARALGGQDYVGYHALMALAPAYRMALAEPAGPRQMVPILKVLYRNTKQIHEHDGEDDVLQHVEPTDQIRAASGQQLRDLVRHADMNQAERAFAGMVDSTPDEAFNALQLAIQDDLNVHRVVLVWRAWALLPLTGPQHAHTMLRQSVRFCVDSEQQRISKGQPEPAIRQALPKLIDQYRLFDVDIGRRQGEDAWLDHLVDTIYLGSQQDAAEAVAAALAEGFAPSAVAEAISLAANRLVLCDPGRPEQWANEAKPAGSVHGDSVGVHASDAANAWRNIATVGDPRTTVTSLVVGAYHTAGQRRGGNEPLPTEQDFEPVAAVAPDKLLFELDRTVRNKQQRRACALAQRYADSGLPPGPLFDLLRKYAISEDGALHAEKYYQTVSEEFALTRSSRRWRHLVALARVTTSQYGFPAPGVEEATRLLA